MVNVRIGLFWKKLQGIDVKDSFSFKDVLNYEMEMRQEKEFFFHIPAISFAHFSFNSHSSRRLTWISISIGSRYPIQFSSIRLAHMIFLFHSHPSLWLTLLSHSILTHPLDSWFQIEIFLQWLWNVVVQSLYIHIVLYDVTQIEHRTCAVTLDKHIKFTIYMNLNENFIQIFIKLIRILI